ncbi:MAG: SpoIIE family protein phosphatase [Hungatella hathewayi]|nr:SpoIIE family protein phosphatase [Hungatella hathewayi]
MKKVVRHSIRYKITAMALGVSVLAVVLCGAVAVFGMRNMIREAATASQSLGETAAYDSRTALVGQAQDGLREQVKQKAELTEERLLNIAGQVETTAGYMSGVYQNPERYLPRPVEKPAMKNAGKWALQYSLVEDVDYEAVQEEIDLAGNLYHIVAPLCEGNDTVSSIYFSSANGFMISYDKNSDNMFEGKTAGQPAELFVDHYDPRDRDWYQEAVETGKSVFTETYLDTFGRLLISCAAPVYGRGTKPVGVLAMDILIEDINHSVVSARVGNRGYVFLMNHDGYVVSAPDLAVVDGTYESVNLMEQEEMKTLAERMASGQSGLISFVKDGEDVFAAFEPIAPTGWSMAMVLPQEEVIAPAVVSYENILENTSRANAQMEGIVHSAMVGVLALSALILLGVLFFTEVRSRKITEPITRLTKEVAVIGQGNLDHTVEMHTGDELETLGNAFNQMTKSLGEYMENLAEVTADRERIATELNVASTIQSSMLPCIFPAFPDQKDFDIYADMHPAKAVGGDFYDFFKTDENHLWVVIADVSGKGVPAALFMVIAKTMLKNYAGFGASPAEVLAIVNDRLCENNEADMFVTVFIGVFEISSGIFTFSNAGHNYPLLYRKGGAFDWLKSSPDFVIAGMEGMKFRDNRVAIKPGDRLFLYTDGVTEALNRKEELYGDDRLIETLNRPETREMSIDELVTYMKADLASYADGAEQADDITMLVLEIREEEK